MAENYEQTHTHTHTHGTTTVTLAARMRANTFSVHSPNVEMTLELVDIISMWHQWVITGSIRCDEWVGAMDVVSECGQWMVDILFTS